MKFLLLLFISINILSGCSSMIGKMHRDFDRADGKKRKIREGGDQFDFYRNQKSKRGLSRRLDSSRKKVHIPMIKRKYKPEKRVKASHLNDNSDGGSLWGAGQEHNFLFTRDTEKSNGDIVLIDVESSLKNEITAELKRAFPGKKKRSKGLGGEAAGGTKTAEGGGPKSKEGAQGADTKEEVFDRISSIVIEEIQKDHLLLRGRKFLLYQNRKRLVEIQALIPRRSISNADTISSAEIIESTVNVIR